MQSCWAEGTFKNTYKILLTPKKVMCVLALVTVDIIIIIIFFLGY